MTAFKPALTLIVLSVLLPVTASFAANWTDSIGTVSIDNVIASPVLAPNGTIYVTSGSVPTGGTLYSIGSDGTVNWTYSIAWANGGEGFPSAAVYTNSRVYVGSGGSLVSLNSSDGTVNWSFSVGGEMDTRPVIGPDGVAYFVTDADSGQSTVPGMLFAITTNGVSKWTHDYTDDDVGGFESSPFIGNDGVVYVKTVDGLFANYLSDGTTKWFCSVATRDEYDLPPVMDSDNLYVGSSDGNLYAINHADGSIVWTYNSGSSVDSRPVLDANGNIIFGNHIGQLYSVNSQGTGQLIFTVPSNEPIESQASFAADGTIYVTCKDGNLYALQRQPDGTAAIAWKFTTSGAIRSNPVVGADGTIYFCSSDGNLYAVDPHLLLTVSPTPIASPTGPTGTPPTLPVGRGLSALYCSDQVSLTWDAYSGATGYRLYRATSATGTYTLIDTTTTGTTYTDTSVVNGTAYYYVVLAVNGGNEIAISDYIRVTPEATPPAPMSLVLAPGNETAYLLSWNSVRGATSYHVKRSTTSGTETTVATTTVTHYTDTGLVNGTTYYYVVSAVNGCDEESANSAEENVTPEYASAPVFTQGSLIGNLFANADTGVPGSGTDFHFFVTGIPNSTWTVYSLPGGNYYEDPQVLGTLTIGPDGTGDFDDDGCGIYDWSDQFYQLVSGDVSSAKFGYMLQNIIDTDPVSGQIYTPVQNPLVSPSPTVGGVLYPVDDQGGNVFWNFSDGSAFDVTSAGFFDDSTMVWDYSWVSGVGWAYPQIDWSGVPWESTGTVVGWNPVNSLPYGYYSDTYYFSGFPCDWSYGSPQNFVMISFIGVMP